MERPTVCEGVKAMEFLTGSSGEAGAGGQAAGASGGLRTRLGPIPMPSGISFLRNMEKRVPWSTSFGLYSLIPQVLGEVQSAFFPISVKLILSVGYRGVPALQL